MSFSEQNIKALIALLESQRISDRDRAELLQLIEPLPDDLETLSDAIAAWYQLPQHLKLCDALLGQIEADVAKRPLPESSQDAPSTVAPVSKSELLAALQARQKRRV